MVAGTYPDHIPTVKGFNAIVMYDVAHCWVKDVSSGGDTAATDASRDEEGDFQLLAGWQMETSAGGWH